VIGLLIWICFVIWFVTRYRYAFAAGPWPNSRRIAWCVAAFGLATAWIGIGALTAIPGTVFTLLAMGWTATPQSVRESESWQLRVRRTAAMQKKLYAPRVSPV
jgi:hypothetical protein